MPSVLLVLIAALAAGYLTGGRLSGVPRMGVRLAALAAIGFGLQLLPLTGLDITVSLILLWVSFGALVLFALVNLRLPGFLLLLLGVLLNLSVISVNDGMPISGEALVAAGDQAQIALLKAGWGGVKYHLADPDDQLMPLADVIVLPLPVGEVVSIGDLVIDAGLGWFLFAAMGSRAGRRPAAGVRARDRPARSRGA
jgi:hypothetical protein